MSESQASIGVVLREAREAQGLTLEQVVLQLKLAKRQVEAIEADAFSELPGNTFVRGFVRNYARLLGVVPEPLLARLNEILPEERTQVAFPRVGENSSMLGDVVRAEPVVSKFRLLAMITLGLLVGGGVAFWYMQKPVSPEIAMEASESEMQAAPVFEPASQASIASQIATLASIPASASASAASVAVISSSSAAIEVRAIEASKPVALIPTASKASAVVVSATKGIRIVTRQDSWVQIVDADEQKLFSGILVAGSDQAWVGKSPYQVRIGNAPNATLYFRGKPVDMASSTRGDVATLELK